MSFSPPADRQVNQVKNVIFGLLHKLRNDVQYTERRNDVKSIYGLSLIHKKFILSIIIF